MFSKVEFLFTRKLKLGKLSDKGRSNNEIITAKYILLIYVGKFCSVGISVLLGYLFRATENREIENCEVFAQKRKKQKMFVPR
jgi:hypothetical protein